MEDDIFWVSSSFVPIYFLIFVPENDDEVFI